MRRLHRTLMLFLLAWLPLQAMGLPLLVASCCSDSSGVGVAHGAPCHEHAADDGASAPAEGGQDGAHDNPGHLCCPQFSAAAAQPFAFTASAVRFDHPPPPLAVRSHVPEQPQRPPRP